MDPALAVMSPFAGETQAIHGALEDAVDAITGPSAAAAAAETAVGGGHSHAWSGAASASNPAAAALDAEVYEEPQLVRPVTYCVMCTTSTTTRDVPKDGMYICAPCLATQAGAPRQFPLGTFKCCPTSTEGADGDVVRCAGCFRWYHLHCVGITDSALRQYVTLSTTSWYCPEPACCDRVLHRQLKRA